MRNHYLPEFYFRPWLDETGHLIRFGWIHDMLKRDPKTPAQICYVKDLHTFTRTISKLPVDAVEHWLTNIDTNASASIRRIVNHGLPALGDVGATHVATFILSLIVRNPDKVRYLSEHSPGDFQKSITAQEVRASDTSESSVSYGFGSLYDYVQTAHPGLIENIGRVIMSDIIVDQHYLRRLFDKVWWVADFSTTSFGTVVATDRLPLILGTGLDDPNSIVVLPLGPRKVLYLAPDSFQHRLAAWGLGVLGVWTQRLLLSNARQYAFGDRRANLNLVTRYLPKPLS
jgi:hypothetical protein